MSRSVVVSLLVGWQEAPFYYDSEPDPDEYNHSIEQAGEFLQLSDDLIKELKKWNTEYQDTYNPIDFQSSGFPSTKAEETWRERGRLLAARIKQESPVVASVDYQANGVIPKGGCVF